MRTISKYIVVFLSFFAFNTSVIFAQESVGLEVDSMVTNETETTENKEVSYVLFQGDTLFTIYANLGPYSSVERAKIISERLEELIEKEDNIDVDLFHVSDSNGYSNIFYKNTLLLHMSEADANKLPKSRKQIASEYENILKNKFGELLEEVTLMDLLKDISFTLLAILGLFLIFYAINKSFKWINSKLTTYEKGLLRKRKNIFKYLVPGNTNNIFLLLAKIVKFALIILILFLYLPLLFSFLPWTKGLAEKFYGYIANPISIIVKGFIDFIPNIFSIIIIVIIARYFLRIISFISTEIEVGNLKIKGFHQDWAKPTFNLLKILIYALSLVFIAQYLPSSKAFQGVSIFVGVLFTLGSTGAISNMIAGIVITYMRPFVIGDRVKIGETVGDVMEKNLLVTRLRTVKNEDITIPNATIINTQLWNYSKNASSIGVIIHPTVTIGYDVPSEQVIHLLMEAAKNTKNLTREFKPFVLQKSLNDFYVEYELNVYTKQPKKMPHFYSELNKNILNEFNQAGVEILSPHYSAFRDGNASTIPESPAPAANPAEQIIDKITGKKT